MTGMLLVLSGCLPTGMETENLMRPPRPTGEKAEIQRVIEQHAGTDVVLQYPRSGDYRSAIISCDVDGDREDEAMAFYRPQGDGSGGRTRFIFMDRVAGEWRVVTEHSIDSDEVDRILVRDLTGSGKKQIIIGWDTYSKTKMAEVYDYSNNRLNPLMKEQCYYTELCIGDFDRDGQDELFTVAGNSSTQSAQARLFKMQSGKLDQISTIGLDQNISGYANIKAGVLNGDGQYGVVLDGYKGTSTLITEVVYYDTAAQRLMVPSQDREAIQDVALRPTVTISRDIDNDGILEIPFVSASRLSMAQEERERNYYTIWKCFNQKENIFYPVLSMYMNYNDGYYLTVPDEWVSKVSIATETAAKKTTFYLAGTALANGSLGTLVGNDPERVYEKLLEIRAFTQLEWSDAQSKGYRMLAEKNNLVYAASVAETGGAFLLTFDQVRDRFKLIAG